jgi:hypothetical protein
MNCDECLLSLEEYVYGELEASASGALSAHLADCGACAGEHTETRRELEIYGRCAVKAPPTLWAAVLEKIEEEGARRAYTPLAAPRAWLAGVLGGRQLGRRAAFASVLIILGSVAWFLFGVTQPDAATGKRVEVVETGAAGGSMTAPDPRRRDDEAAADQLRHVAKIEPGRGVTLQLEGRRGRVSRGTAVGALVAGRAPRIPTVSGHTPTEAAAAIAVSRPTTGVPRPPGAAAEIDNETTRHFERARMLLRSFKNGRLSKDDPTFDIAYERRVSRDLLGKNNLLRSDARSEGNEAVERLLSRLEPFLLDIANLGEDSTPEEMRSIKERMRSEAIIARLSLF